MNIDYLIQEICDEIRRSNTEPDVVRTVISILINEGVDIRREPSLEAAKRILVEATCAANERQCVGLANTGFHGRSTLQAYSQITHQS